MLQKLLRRRKKRLVIAFDWTKFGSLHTLALVAVFGGRGVPLLWKTVGEFGLFKTLNRIELQMLSDLQALLPKACRVVDPTEIPRQRLLISCGWKCPPGTVGHSVRLGLPTGAG